MNSKLTIEDGPPMIKSENARVNGWVFIDIENVDLGTYVKNAQAAVSEELSLPASYSLQWSGQFEYMERAQQRLQIVVPFTLIIILVLLYLNFRRVTESVIVMLSLPFALIGGVWLMYWLDYDFSVAVGVGFIALAGVAAETGVLMLVYLEQACKRWKEEGKLNTPGDLMSAIVEGAAERVRPIMMTVTSTVAGLLPIMWGVGTGSDVMQRIAAPMVGGMASAIILTLVVIPVVYFMLKSGALVTDD